MRRNFFPGKVAEQWHRLPTEVVDSLAEDFQIPPGCVPVPLSPGDPRGRRVGLNGLQRSLPTPPLCVTVHHDWELEFCSFCLTGPALCFGDCLSGTRSRTRTAPCSPGARYVCGTASRVTTGQGLQQRLFRGMMPVLCENKACAFSSWAGSKLCTHSLCLKNLP